MSQVEWRLLVHRPRELTSLPPLIVRERAVQRLVDVAEPVAEIDQRRRLCPGRSRSASAGSAKSAAIAEITQSGAPPQPDAPVTASVRPRVIDEMLGAAPPRPVVGRMVGIGAGPAIFGVERIGAEDRRMGLQQPRDLGPRGRRQVPQRDLADGAMARIAPGQSRRRPRQDGQRNRCKYPPHRPHSPNPRLGEQYQIYWETPSPATWGSGQNGMIGRIRSKPGGKGSIDDCGRGKTNSSGYRSWDRPPRDRRSGADAAILVRGRTGKQASLFGQLGFWPLADRPLRAAFDPMRTFEAAR